MSDGKTLNCFQLRFSNKSHDSPDWCDILILIVRTVITRICAKVLLKFLYVPYCQILLHATVNIIKVNNNFILVVRNIN